MRKSALFRGRTIISAPVPSITEGPSLFPHSSTHCEFGGPRGTPCPCRLHIGFTTFHASNRDRRILPFRRWFQCQRALTNQQHNQPRRLLGGPFRRFGPSGLRRFISSSLTLIHYLEPSASPSTSLGFTPGPHGAGIPPAGRLHCRSAQHKTVTGFAPLLGYGRLDIRSDIEQPASIGQLLARLAPRSSRCRGSQWNQRRQDASS